MLNLYSKHEFDEHSIQKSSQKTVKMLVKQQNNSIQSTAAMITMSWNTFAARNRLQWALRVILGKMNLNSVFKMSKFHSTKIFSQRIFWIDCFWMQKSNANQDKWYGKWKVYFRVILVFYCNGETCAIVRRIECSLVNERLDRSGDWSGRCSDVCTHY